MVLYCELFDTRPAGSDAQMCREIFLHIFTFVWLNLCLLLPAQGSVQWKRIGGGICQFDKADLVSQMYFQAALPGRQVQSS